MRNVLLLLMLFGCSPAGTFDSERWKNADVLTRDRVEMIADLRAQLPLKGLSRAEVVDLLGEPTQTNKCDDWDMIYVLGPTDYMPIDNEWLVIKLDAAGRISDYDVVAD
jgi:hypothetical protein